MSTDHQPIDQQIITAMCLAFEIPPERKLRQRIGTVQSGKDFKKGLGFDISRETRSFYMSGYDSLPQRESRLVCVTSATSYLGVSIVNILISRGYSVRALVDNAEELEKLAENIDECNNKSMDLTGIVIDVMNLESVLSAIDGSVAVFHTSSFLDTAGVSGYTKHMARIETAATENLVEACARVSSVRRCVLTSTLLACIWQPDVFNVIDENCWSDESFCREKQLWFALSKTMMEKAAWKIATGRDVELVTICPALITGVDFHKKIPSSSIAYLKGGSEMYRNGVLAGVDVEKVAGAHVNVYETCDTGGRYICYDRIMDRKEEIAKLERLIGIHPNQITGDHIQVIKHSKLKDGKLFRLMTRYSGCSPFQLFQYL